MAALTEGVRRGLAGGYEIENLYLLMAPSQTIYEGAALTIDGGRVSPLTSGAGKRFIGFAMQSKTTTAGQTHEEIHVQIRGMLPLTVAGAALSHICDPVYATDDNTFTLNSAGDAVKIGHLLTGSNGQWMVLFDAFAIAP